MTDFSVIELLATAHKTGYMQALNKVTETINAWANSDDDDSSLVEKIADLRKEEPDYAEIFGK